MPNSPHSLFCVAGAGAFLLAGGCGPPSDAELSIAGDTILHAEAGEEVLLEARYHDERGVPLAGDVAFSIVGDDTAASLSEAEVATDEFGLAEVALATGAEGDARIEVLAEAGGAEPVRWEVDVAPPPPLDPTGAYHLTSELDVTAGLAGRTGSAIDRIIDMTDDRADPTLWLLERLVARLPERLRFDPPYALALAANRVVLDVLAPAIVGRVRDLGRDFGRIATGFGVTSRLEVSGEEGARRARHAVTGFFMDYRRRRYEISLDDLGFEAAPATEVAVEVSEDEGRIAIEEHELPIDYGALLIFALDEIVLADFGGDLEGFLREGLPCDVVTEELIERVDVLPSSAEGVVREACVRGIAAGAERARDALLEARDAELTLALAGEATPVVEGAERRMDAIEDGHWEGEAQMAGRAAPLVRAENTFIAERADDYD